MERSEVKFLDLPKFVDKRGILSFFQNGDQLPFDIKTVSWVTDVPPGTRVGDEANKDCEEVIIAMAGSFDVTVHDTGGEQTYTLTRPDQCFYIPRHAWRQVGNFSADGIAFITTG